MLTPKVKDRLHAKFAAWLKQRMPPSHKQQLTGKNIFILPSKFGIAYLLFTMMLFLLGTNYQNNLIILLSFTLASLFITTMLHSFFNLAGLTISSYAQPQGFAEQEAQVAIKLNSNKARYHINCQFKQHPSAKSVHCQRGNCELKVPILFAKRGLHRLTRLTLSSHYPLGLFITWTRLDLDISATVYPAPKMPARIVAQAPEAGNEQHSKHYSHNQPEDFIQLKPHQLGESLSQVAWKQVASGQGWFSKQYGAPTSNELYFSLAQMPSSYIEDKLSNLCALILDADKQQRAFALKLGSQQVDINQGRQHVRNCLTLLAKY